MSTDKLNKSGLLTKSLSIPEKLRLMRGELSQKAFAKKLGVTLRCYHRYESAERVPSADVLKRLAALQGVSIETFLDQSHSDEIKLSRKELQTLKNVFNNQCAICGFGIEETLRVFHIVPLNKGGSDDLSNLIILCANHHIMAAKRLIGTETLKAAQLEVAKKAKDRMSKKKTKTTKKSLIDEIEALASDDFLMSPLDWVDIDIDTLSGELIK